MMDLDIAYEYQRGKAYEEVIVHLGPVWRELDVSHYVIIVSW
jgi:hypothetical protein